MRIAWPRLIVLVLLFLLSGTSAFANATYEDTSQLSTLHAQWDELLSLHVYSIDNGNSTAVDYASFSRDSSKLDAYLNTLASVSESTFNTWSKEARLAFLINAYNAYTVKLIITAYPNITSILELERDGVIPWKQPFAPLLGSTRTLDDIEHVMIRGNPELMEPRIHFAVNCASIGCPALRQEAYIGEALSQQLDEQTRQFLGDTSRNRIEGDTLYLSQIFEWYKGDFKQQWHGASSLPSFVLLYADALSLNQTQKQQLANGTIAINHIPYDWALNDFTD